MVDIQPIFAHDLDLHYHSLSAPTSSQSFNNRPTISLPPIHSTTNRPIIKFTTFSIPSIRKLVRARTQIKPAILIPNLPCCARIYIHTHTISTATIRSTRLHFLFDRANVNGADQSEEVGQGKIYIG